MAETTERPEALVEVEEDGAEEEGNAAEEYDDIDDWVDPYPGVALEDLDDQMQQLEYVTPPPGRGRNCHPPLCRTLGGVVQRVGCAAAPQSPPSPPPPPASPSHLAVLPRPVVVLWTDC